MYFVNQCIQLTEVARDDTVVEQKTSTCATCILTTSGTMFLALAVLLNINKWIYFTLRIQAQINIREYEIAELMAEDHEEMLESQEQMQQQNTVDSADENLSGNIARTTNSNSNTIID